MRLANNGLPLVEFLKSSGPYSIGTRATFSLAEAQKLVKQGTARYVGGATPTPSPPPSEVKTNDGQQARTQGDDPLEQIVGNDEWRSINAQTLKAIARRIVNGPVSNKNEAIDIIKEALKERASEGEGSGEAGADNSASGD